MKTPFIYVIACLCFAFASTSFGQTECTFNANSGGFEYTVDAEFELNSVTTSQQGTTCNATIVVDYSFLLTPITTPPFQQPPRLFNFQINMNCAGAQNPTQTSGNGANSPMGMFTLTNFSFPNTVCSDLVLDCPFTVTISGSGGYGETNVSCGTINQACARSIF